MDEIYELAVYYITHFAHTKDVAIYTALQGKLNQKTEEEKRKILGDEIYTDYLVYKNRLKRKDYKTFLNVFNAGMSNFNLDSDELNEESIERNINLNSKFGEELIIAKIAREHFPSKNLEAYINSLGII